MSDFVTDVDAFARSSRCRIAAEVACFTVLTGALLSPWAASFPLWLRVVALLLVGGFLLYNIVSYPKAKRDVSEGMLSVRDHGLVSVFQGSHVRISYEDLSLGKVKRRFGKIVSIRLDTRFGNRMTLKNFENMDALYDELKHRLT